MRSSFVRRVPPLADSLRRDRVARLLAAIEPCEPRRLLASVSGTVFNDANKNGTREGGENGLSGVTVFADRNYDGVMQASELRAVTDANGFYRITGIVADGTSTGVRLDGVDASRITAPAGGGHSARFASDYEAAGRNFAVAPTATATVGGVLFVDANGNGARDGGEGLVPANDVGAYGSYTVYADLNRNGQLDDGEPSVYRSGGDASFSIDGVPAGATFDLRFNSSPADNGYVQTTPGGFLQPLTITAPAAGDSVTANVGFKPGAKLYAAAIVDVNGNGAADAGEPQARYGAAWIDLDGDRLRDANEPLVTTDLSKFYLGTPGPLADQTVAIPFGQTFALAFGPNFAVGSAATATATVNVAAGTPSFAARFSVKPTAPAVTGLAYDDANGNGAADAGEAGLIDRVLFADYNNNGVFDADDDGMYLDNKAATTPYYLPVKAGRTFTLRVLDYLAGPSTEVTATYVRTLTGTQQAAGLDFRAAPAPVATATVTGTVYADANANGKRDGGEAGLSGRTVYADLNYDGVKQSNEPSALTNASGFYSIAGIAPQAGSVAIRLLDVPASQITAPAGGFHSAKFTSAYTAAGRDFGVRSTTPATATVFGYAYLDANRNGVRDAGERAQYARVYVDANNNGVLDAGEQSVDLFSGDGRFQFAGVPAGTPVTVRAINLDESYPGTVFANADSAFFPAFTLTPAAGSTVFVGDFVGTTRAGGIVAQAFTDLNGDGVRQVYDPDRNTLDRWVDLDRDGVHDADEPEITSRFTGNGDPIGQDFSYVDVPPGTYRVAIRELDGTVKSKEVTVAEGGRAIVGFPVASARPIVAGVVYRDLNANRLQDAGEPGLSLASVFADYNGNGAIDGGEPVAPTASDGTYYLEVDANRTFTLRATTYVYGNGEKLAETYTTSLSAGEKRTTYNFGYATVATVTGTIFSDDNRNGVRDGAEVALNGAAVFADLNYNGTRDNDEPVAFANAGGFYSLAIPTQAGSVAIRLYGLPASQVTTPAGGFHSGKFTTPYTAGGRDFGVAPTSVAQSGFLFRDLDGNGYRGVGEPGLGGRTVYIDANNNGRLDAGEFSAVTRVSDEPTSAGYYELPGGRITGKANVVRVVPLPNETPAIPAKVVAATDPLFIYVDLPA